MEKIIRLDIDMAVSVSNNLQEYFDEMKRMGYDMRIGQSENMESMYLTIIRQ